MLGTVGGRPGLRRLLVLYFFAASLRCQASSVAGATGEDFGPAPVGMSRASAANQARSAGSTAPGRRGGAAPRSHAGVPAVQHPSTGHCGTPGRPSRVPGTKQIDDLEQHPASQPGPLKSAGDRAGQPLNRAFERHRFGAATRDRFLAAIEQLHYEPHAGAASLRSGRTYRIAYPIPDTELRPDHAPNTVGNFCFEVTLGYRRLERGSVSAGSPAGCPGGAGGGAAAGVRVGGGAGADPGWRAGRDRAGRRDRRIASWLAGWDAATVLTVASWIARSRAAGPGR